MLDLRARGLQVGPELAVGAGALGFWKTPSRAQAERAFDRFVTTCEGQYPKATECLAKDRAEQLAFYDFPAEHWVHIRTTNPVESTLATVRLRTHKTRGCLSRHTAMTMVFKLIQSAQKRWRRLNASDYLKDVIPGVEFRDGVRADGQMEQEDKAAAA